MWARVWVISPRSESLCGSRIGYPRAGFGAAGGLSALLTAQFVCLSAAKWFFWRQSGNGLGSTGRHRNTLGLTILVGRICQYYLPFGLMLTFPEGFITGAFLTMLVLFQPRWLYTFRDEVYQLKS